VKRFVLAEPAEADLDSIKNYLVERAGTNAARRVVSEIRAQIRVLARNPQAGHIRKDLTSRPLKFWPVYSYLLVYDPEAKPIQVLRILHGRRDVEALLKRV
jgi:toxin ParE1/3/4